jgi:hypothetical protein
MSMQPISIDTPLAPAPSASAHERQRRITLFRLLVEMFGRPGCVVDRHEIATFPLAIAAHPGYQSLGLTA